MTQARDVFYAGHNYYAKEKKREIRVKELLSDGANPEAVRSRGLGIERTTDGRQRGSSSSLSDRSQTQTFPAREP